MISSLLCFVMSTPSPEVSIRDEIKVLKFCLKEPTTTSENIKEENELTKLTNLLTSNLNTWIKENEISKLTTSLNAWMNRGGKEQATARLADLIIILRTTIIMIITYLIFVIFLHRQNFWRIKFTLKNT